MKRKTSTPIAEHAYCGITAFKTFSYHLERNSCFEGIFIHIQEVGSTTLWLIQCKQKDDECDSGRNFLIECQQIVHFSEVNISTERDFPLSCSPS